MLKDDEED